MTNKGDLGMGIEPRRRRAGIHGLQGLYKFGNL